MFACKSTPPPISALLDKLMYLYVADYILCFGPRIISKAAEIEKLQSMKYLGIYLDASLT